MDTQNTIKKETIFRLFIPKESALDLNRFLDASRKNNFDEKWKRYNIQVFIVGFVNLEGGKIFHPECFSTNTLPVDTVKEFIVQISSLDEKTNDQILHGFVKQLSENLFKEFVS